MLFSYKVSNDVDILQIALSRRPTGFSLQGYHFYQSEREGREMPQCRINWDKNNMGHVLNIANRMRDR